MPTSTGTSITGKSASEAAIGSINKANSMKAAITNAILCPALLLFKLAAESGDTIKTGLPKIAPKEFNT